MPNIMILRGIFTINRYKQAGNKVFPFVACGDLSGYDSDMSYPLSINPDSKPYNSLDVVQPPISPAYRHACELRKSGNIQKE